MKNYFYSCVEHRQLGLEGPHARTAHAERAEKGDRRLHRPHAQRREKYP